MKLILLFTLTLGFISCDKTREPSSSNQQELRLSQSFVGVDMNDSIRSCIDKFNQLSCPEIFTDSDAFALSCERGGKYAIQCGCHDWICVDTIDLDSEVKY